LITPLARRRPWIVARHTVSVDWASVGRFTLGVGLGDPVQWDFGFFHEDTDPRHRASKLDESLDIIQKLWTGEMVSHKGENYQLEPMQFLPKPVDRIPIWVGGNYPKRRPMLRAARYDGFYPLKWTGGMQPADWRDTMDYIRKQRAELGKTDAPFDVVNGGRVPEDRWHAAESVVAPYAEVGVNWWIEDISPWRFGLPWEKPWTADFSTIMHDAIRRGAPKL
jgi:alkanesulfonate monooxygenase SsuD/methylene tetrahydromethanopterin reductase-like flavin-dependent oxidoreductase (luciferase family)